MDVKYIGGDTPWTLPFGDHYYSSSQASFTNSHQNTSELEIIARRHGFEPLYSTNEKQSSLPDNNSRWMNAGVFFTDKTIQPHLTGIHKTDYHDDHGHTFCYLCSINQHHHERTKPRDQSRRRKLIPYSNPKAIKARSASLDRNIQNVLTSDLIPYRFIVRTDAGKNSGTRAQVFLYMYGTENDWTSINLRGHKNSVDGFPSGSIRTVCLKGPDIGHLEHLNVNLVGARSDKEWFLKEIEITNLNTSVTWLCEFDCWLPNKDEYEVIKIKPKPKRHSELTSDNLSVYILQVRTGGKPFAGTDSTIQVTVHGSISQTRRLPLTSNQSDLFEQNQLDTFAIVGWDIGDLLEITVESDKSQMAADWDLKEMTMWKIIPGDDHKQYQVYFPFNKWLGKKVSTLKAKRDTYQSTDHHPRGPTCYHVSVQTGKALGAGTDANVFLIIYGKSGRTSIHLLDNPNINDFERNTTSEFTIMDIDVGKIDRIKIWHDDSGAGSPWFLDSIIIRKKHSTCRPITNVFVQRLEQLSKALYRHAREQIKKNSKGQTSSAKENEHYSTNRRTTKSKDYDDNESNDRLGSSRGILRSPVMNDKHNLQKTVRFDEHSIGSQDEPIRINTQEMKSMKNKIEQDRQKDDSRQIESGHFDHRAYWISSHNYSDGKWQIKSLEESNSFDLDQPTRSLLLADRLIISKKIQTPIHEKDDDIYEFAANRWLDKDKEDHKLEVNLSPKSFQLSTHTNDEIKSKSSDTKTKQLSSTSKTTSDSRHENYNDHDDDNHSKRSSQYNHGSIERSSRSSAPYDTSKTKSNDSRPSQYDHGSTERSPQGPTSHAPLKTKLNDSRPSQYDHEPTGRSSRSSASYDPLKTKSNDSRPSQYDHERTGRSSRSSASYDPSKTKSNDSRPSQDDHEPSEKSPRSSASYDPSKTKSNDSRLSQYDQEPTGRSSRSSASYDPLKTKLNDSRSSQPDLGPIQRSPRDSASYDPLKAKSNDSRPSQYDQEPTGRSSRSSASYDPLKTKLNDSRSFQPDLGPIQRSPRDSASYDPLKAKSNDFRPSQYDHEATGRSSRSSASYDPLKAKSNDSRPSQYDQEPTGRSSRSSASYDPLKTKLNDSRSSQPDLGPIQRSPRDSASYDPLKAKSNDFRPSQYDHEATGRSSRSSASYDPLKTKSNDSRPSQDDHEPSEKSPRSSASYDPLKAKSNDSRSSQHDLGPIPRSPRGLASYDPSKTKSNDSRPSQYDHEPSERSPRSSASYDPLKTKLNDSRSSERNDQNVSSTSKRQEESSVDKYHQPSSPYQRAKSSPHNNDSKTSERDLLERISGEPPYHSRSSATSLINTQSSSVLSPNQHLKSPKTSNELNSNRESSLRSKSTIHSNVELASHKTTRTQEYNSAYGTVPIDD